MDSNLLAPLSSSSGPKLRQRQDAQTMQQAVLDRANRTGEEPPPYEFLELIGKGTYGRVYKSLANTNEGIVAIKIIEVDEPDYEATFEARNDTIENFTKEINALQRLKDSNAKNVTMIYDAFTFHSQLWLVSEYCQGGSVNTLMKACPDKKLEESFIIPIARELAIALKYIHEADIVHRDIKCANILIMEDGNLRLADFGVAGIFESNVSKRKTIIGTPHWMPLELVEELGNESPDISYGTEVDIWAFGCAVYEMAAGHAPNARVKLPNLANALRQTAPRLDDQKGPYSDKLREFVEFCLQLDPQARPTARGILESPFVAGSAKRYPTESLQQLVERFYAWETRGGERQSLFWDMGAKLPTNLEDDDEEQEDWYFSTTLEFEQQ
ncbi:kinase-like protein, partial [Rhizodiscina lignyota]